MEYDGRKIKRTFISGDGDFKSPECVEILKQADIVCTNPPFSLFREYIDQLMKHKKKFIIIGNLGAASYKEIFPLIQNNKMWIGCTPKKGQGDLTFKVPDDYTATSSRLKIDKNGQKWMSQGMALWFTNLPHVIRKTPLSLWKKYTPNEYPIYDNHDAIEVKPYKHIPMDYDGIMGVPITFLSKHNPDQFEIVGIDWQMEKTKLVDNKKDAFYLGGKRLFTRIAIKHKRGK